MSLDNAFILSGHWRCVAGTPGTAVEIARIDDSHGYDWDYEAIVLRLADGALFFYKDAGCSCSGPYDDIDWSSLTPINGGTQLPHLLRRVAWEWQRAGRPACKLAADLLTTHPDMDADEALKLALLTLAP